MKAIILAAGRGSRLHPYTADCPKCLTELGGRSLIDWQLATLRQCGIEDILLVSGYRAELLDFEGTRRIVNARWAETNMVESLFCAEDEFGDDMIVAYADILYQPSIVEKLLAARGDASVVVDRKWRDYWEFRFESPLDDAESLRLDGSGRILDIGRKVADIEEIEAQYIGLMRFRGAGIAALRAARARLRAGPESRLGGRSPENAYMTDLLTEMIEGGNDVHAVPVDGGWLEVDTVEDFEKTSALFETGRIGRFFDPATVGGDGSE